MADMQDYFSLAQAFTARWEGGFSDHPADTGGLTAYGASMKFVEGIAATLAGQNFLKSIGVCLPISRHSMMEITQKQAADMFRHEFWDHLNLNMFPLAMSCVLYDAAVNCGCTQSVKFAQRGYNACAEPGSMPLAVDGKIGTLTTAALRDHATPAVLTAILDARQAFYNALVVQKPSQKAFMEGWTNRVNALRAYVKSVLNGVSA